MKIAVVIPTFRGAWRLAKLLESVEVHDRLALTNDLTEWLVVEDPSDEKSTTAYLNLLDRYPEIDFHKLHAWSNMHGAAKYAFEIATKEYSPEWIIYLGDDVLVTPLALTNMLHFLRHNRLVSVGLVQFPYWNAHDLTADGYAGEGGRAILGYKQDMYSKDVEWLLDVPLNPYWNQHEYAHVYVNVNGVGFACKTSHFHAVGGFAEGTWCLDESLSVRTWLRSPLGIVQLPGPPLVHYFGGATESGPPPHDLHTAERWTIAMGMTKEDAGELSYKAMFEREPTIHEEMQRAIYHRRYPAVV